MKLEDLQTIVAGMTARPWRVERAPHHDPRLYAHAAVTGIIRHDADADALLALANHADALVELWRAASEYVHAHEDDQDRILGALNAMTTVIAKLEAVAP